MPTSPHTPDELRRGPFLGSVARHNGLLTQKQLRSRAWRRLFADVYASATIPDSLELRIRAAQLLLPAGAVISETAAAFVHGADIRRRNEGLDVTVTVPRDLPFHPRAGLTIRHAELLPEDSETVAGIPVTTPIRTAFDIARRTAVRGNLTEHVVAADALTCKGLFTPGDLAAYACRERFRGWRGIRQVDQVAAHTEPLTESPGETRVRMRIVLAGLPGRRPRSTSAPRAGPSSGGPISHTPSCAS